ncbi:hypothetical protein FNW02_35140 [Komarekiella sp. 'clone 1']|uniref:Uncharacterized protein n=1 Tax=Komarekiella delphini-convector SJRDD-AB1 TaxID=2593771 RepID=A0AA40T553_9NOST|nr:hypothetical protein [Komarekiella delphini-convector]MBD6620848.1 hypothetical protein [Komarekiella delphini-convector SJRDD-AB1]
MEIGYFQKDVQIIELDDFVRPRTAPKDSVWRVVEIKGNRITAQKQYHELEPKQIKRVSSTPDFFYLIDEDDND